MTQLNFRIVMVPEIPILYDHGKNKLRSELKYYLESCDIDVRYLSIFEATKAEDSHSEIEELIFQIDAKIGKSYPTFPPMQYKHFCKKWKKLMPDLPCSYIMLYSDDSFLDSIWSFIDIRCQSLQFGVLPHDGYFHEYMAFDRNITGTFYHDTRTAILRVGKFILEFSYDNIRNVFVNSFNLPAHLFFDLYNPPIVYTTELYEQGEFKSKIRRRNLNLGGMIDPDILGRANVLSIEFSNNDSELEKIVANIHSRCSSKPIVYSCISTISKFKPSTDIPEKLNEMPFNCTYLMTALLKRNFVLMAQLSPDFDYQKVIDHSKHNPKALENAMSDVLSALESGRILNYWDALEKCYNFHVNLRNLVDFKEYIIPPRCFLTRRIIITPTRLLLWPEELTFGNRVIRKFDSDFAIRVSFRDDNLQNLTTVAQNADRFFLEFSIKRPLINGIRIGKRHYKFLAWSNSQLRDHSVWMYAKDLKGITSDYIRKWMGDFSHIHNVPKYMARMGQCFSQTVDTISVPLEPQSVRTVPDIVRGYDPESKKPYVFSDGVGRISTELTAKVHKALEDNKLCCAFQIRYSGYKGMLVVDPTLKDAQIEFRESMKKFNCPNSTKLEIARVSAPVPLHLNRPLITILNDLGVRHRVFLRLQETMLKNLTDMLYDEEKAVECLKLKTQVMYDYEDISKSGIYLTTEKFFRNILLAVHRHQIGCLKSKANVCIDPNFARNMLGVLDETGLLNYGEVFVQYSKDVHFGKTTREKLILEGEVLVTKSPCHHPGDVRKFTAVDIPQLHHIVDCIVFSQNGKRPEHNEMSGGDLDGDEYAVIWLKELIFYCPNKPAARFPVLKCKDKHNIGVNDMIDYFQDYIKKDQIGRISSAHLALADSYGVESDICQAVARKVSIAVDFAKSGIVEPLKPEERPIQYPDFMEKLDRDDYKSFKALGKMYRICRDYEIENKETSIMYQPLKVDSELLYPGWEKYKRKAIRAKKKYDMILGSLLRNYGIEHEAEVISGAFTDLHCRFQERSDRMDVMKVVTDCFKKLISDTLREFIEEFMGCNDAKELDEAVLQKASAYYQITYSDPKSQYLSFAWTVYKFLAAIKMRKSADRNTTFSPAIVEMDKKIIECERKKLLPFYKETYISSICKYPCDQQIVERALRVLILWAREEKIIEVPGRHQGLLFTGVFVRLFFHVAELNKYIFLPGSSLENENKSFSSAKLCIEFLKFCSSLRFYSSNDIQQVLPFFLYKHTILAKRAVLAYHKFALSGFFRTLYFNRKTRNNLLDMNPFPVNMKLFPSTTESSLLTARDILIKHSGAKTIRLREHHETKKIWVSAIGNERALKELKLIFRKEAKFVHQLLLTGKMPETKKKYVADTRENGVKENGNEDETDKISSAANFENRKRKKEKGKTHSIISKKIKH